MGEFTAADPGRCEDPAGRLEELWRQGQRPELPEFLAAAGALSPAEMVSVLRVDQRWRWQAGERVLAETYLQQHAELRVDPEAAVALIYGEYLLREERGETPPLDEYLQRFPEYAERLREQVQFHQALQVDDGTSLKGVPTLLVSLSQQTAAATAEAARGEPARPAVPGYEIQDELGRGGMGVVYRAWQPHLKRLVVLKMILAGAHAGPEERARFRIEAESVARLQHAHIVQLYELGEHQGHPYLVLENGTISSGCVTSTSSPCKATAARSTP